MCTRYRPSRRLLRQTKQTPSVPVALRFSTSRANPPGRQADAHHCDDAGRIDAEMSRLTATRARL